MSKINLRGVIVPADYDVKWFEPYIEKGMITPESRFRAELASANPSEDLDIYVNSPGGSVFSAYEMVNAVRQWKADNKKKANITVGGLAASAAAFFTTEAGSTVKAHKNSKMMFHGATAEVWGGKQAMEDEAKLLGQINAGIQNTLISKYGLSPETVAEWFSEGRQGWLDAEEMKKAGIAGEIITDDADVIVFDDEAISAMDSQGLKIAAYVKQSEKEPLNGNDEPAGTGEKPAEEKAKEPNPQNAGTVEKPVDVDGKDYAAGYEKGKSEGLTQAATEHASAIQANADALVSVRQEHASALALKDEHVAKLNALLSKLQGEKDSAKSQVDKLSDSLKTTSEKLNRLLSGGLGFSPSVETWEDAVKTSGGDYVKARKDYPHIHAALLVAANKRK